VTVVGAVDSVGVVVERHTSFKHRTCALKRCRVRAIARAFDSANTPAPVICTLYVTTRTDGAVVGAGVRLAGTALTAAAAVGAAEEVGRGAERAAEDVEATRAAD
jgi:hypothetical protein